MTLAAVITIDDTQSSKVLPLDVGPVHDRQLIPYRSVDLLYHCGTMSHVEFGSDTLHRDDEYTALRFPTTPHPTATNQQRAPFGMNPPVNANLFIQTSDFISADAKENAMESSSGVKRMQEEEAAAANNANPTQSAPAAKKQKKKVVLVRPISRDSVASGRVVCAFKLNAIHFLRPSSLDFARNSTTAS